MRFIKLFEQFVNEAKTEEMFISMGADGMSAKEKKDYIKQINSETGATVSIKGNDIAYRGTKEQLRAALEIHFPDGDEDDLDVDSWIENEWQS
jgi:hypothetical protein